MRVRTLLSTLTLLAASLALAGCVRDDADESAADGDRLPDGNGTSAMCVEGAEDCDDTPTTETVEDPYQVGT